MFFGLASLGVLALAFTTWDKIAVSATGTVASMDVDSLETSGNLTKVWISYDFSRDKTQVARSGVTRFQIDCQTKLIRTISMVRYAPTGRILADEKTPSSGFDEIVPGSFGDDIASAVCGHAQTRNRILGR